MPSKWIHFEMFGYDVGQERRASELPPIPACYAIYCDGALVYIGQTTNLYKRIYSYSLRYSPYSSTVFTPWRDCETIDIKFRPMRRYGDWAMVELRLIRRLQPIFNCVGSIKKRAVKA